MAFKKITLVLLPDGARNMKQIKIPRFLLYFSCLFSIALASFLVWGVRDYRSIKTTIPQLADLEAENEQQKRQIASLAQKIDHISGKMIELKKFDQKLRTMVNLETNDDSSGFLGIGGSDPSVVNPDYTIEKAHKKLVRLMHQSAENLNSEISVQIKDTAELCRYLEDQRSLLASTPSIWPVEGWVSSGFGHRISPFTNEKEFHSGLDISGRMKTPVIAPADGIVTFVGENYGYGKFFHLNHEFGLKTIYGHLSEVLVKKGQYVKRGEKIGLLGSSGRTTGPHVHYEVQLKGVPVDPRRYILN